jgi:hypothetical protein
MLCAAPVAVRPALEVADIVRDFGEAFRRSYTLTPDQAEVLRAIARCRTAALGGHLDTCDRCGLSQPSYNSCRNRHCPKCQGSTQKAWIEERARRILAVGHFHVVFTVPDALHRLAAFRREEVFGALFAAASATLLELGASRLGAQLGFTMVLHTWTRDLRFHPHVHAIVSSGGLSLDGVRWLAHPRFLLPVRVLGVLFRGKMLDAIRRLHTRGAFAGFDHFRDPKAFDRTMAKLASKRWVVYAKRPFGRPEHVLAYLGRYTHRVGISNRRLLARRADHITFATKNGQTATLSGVDFLRRFVQHVLPKHFVKIRHYGLYAASHIDTTLATARKLLDRNTPLADSSAVDASPADPSPATVVRPCPGCLVGSLIASPGLVMIALALRRAASWVPLPCARAVVCPPPVLSTRRRPAPILCAMNVLARTARVGGTRPRKAAPPLHAQAMSP